MFPRPPLAVCLALAVLGCGGVADDLTRRDPAPRVVRREPPSTSQGGDESDGASPEASEADEPNGVPPSGDEVNAEEGEIAPFDGVSSTDLLLQELGTTCGSCHGDVAVANDEVQGGFDCVEDIDCSARLGFVIPLSSSQSRLIQVMRDQSMPPPGVQPRPSPELINALAQLIDNPLFWPEP